MKKWKTTSTRVFPVLIYSYLPSPTAYVPYGEHDAPQRCGPTHCSTTHAISERARGQATRSAVALFAPQHPSTKQQLQKSEHRTTLTRVHFDWGRSVGAPWWARRGGRAAQGPRPQCRFPSPSIRASKESHIPRRGGRSRKTACYDVQATAPRGASQRGCARRRCNLVNKGDGA